MIAKRRQFSESQLSCEAMSETNKYSFEKSSSAYFTPCNESFPAVLTTSPSCFVVVGLRGKAATQQSHDRPATLNLPIWCFGCWCPEELWVGMHRENVRFSWSTTNNKVSAHRLLEQCTTRLWCPSYLQWKNKIMIKNKDFQNNVHGGLIDPFGLLNLINDYLNSLKNNFLIFFPEKCSRRPQWPIRGKGRGKRRRRRELSPRWRWFYLVAASNNNIRWQQIISSKWKN